MRRGREHPAWFGARSARAASRRWRLAKSEGSAGAGGEDGSLDSARDERAGPLRTNGVGPETGAVRADAAGGDLRWGPEA